MILTVKHMARSGAWIARQMAHVWGQWKQLASADWKQLQPSPWLVLVIAVVVGLRLWVLLRRLER